MTQRHIPSALSFIESVIQKRPQALLDEDELATEIRKSGLLETEKLKLIDNLWRASMASIAYDRIRVAEVHGPGSVGLSFDQTEYKGKKGVTLDFDKFYEALRQILKSVRAVSLASGEWFGNPNYIKEVMKS